MAPCRATGGDTLRQERLTRDLHETLRESNGLAVGFEEGGKAAETGHKGAAAADVALWATASLPAARVLITLIKEWCAKERHRSVKVTYRGKSITITTGPGATDGLLQRLYQVLSQQPGSTVVLGEQVNGHPADAVVRGADGTATTVLLDRGVEDGSDAARHLRLSLHRRALLDGGGNGHSAIRYPAWRLYDFR